MACVICSLRYFFLVLTSKFFQGAAHAGELAALFFVVIFAAATQVFTTLDLPFDLISWFTGHRRGWLVDDVNIASCIKRDYLTSTGWALTLLSKRNVAYASTCQTIGLQIVRSGLWSCAKHCFEVIIFYRKQRYISFWLDKEDLWLHRSFTSFHLSHWLLQGFSLAYTLFMPLNSAEFWLEKAIYIVIMKCQALLFYFHYLSWNFITQFSNKYLRSEPSDEGLLQVGALMRGSAVAFFVVSAWLLFFKKEVFWSIWTCSFEAL